jgi:hypothetical protein
MLVPSEQTKEIHMRAFGILIFTLLIAAVVGVGAYQLGLAQGLGATGTAVAPVAYYHPYFFGGFGFLFPLLFILFIFALMRGASRGWGRGYGGGWSGAGGYMGPRERLEELHRELHGEKSRDSGAQGTPPAPSGR